MLVNELNSLQEELHYHRVAIEELEQKIAEAKSYEAFAIEATDAVKSAIEQIGVGKYLWLFREHLISLFPQEAPKYLEAKPQEEHLDTSYTTEEKDPKVFDPPQSDISPTDGEVETNVIILSDNVVYDQDTNCIHIGSKVSSDGYDWRDELCYKQGLSTKSWFEEAEHLENYPKELIIEGITLEQARELAKVNDFTKPPAKHPIKVREELYEKPHYPDPKIPIKLADYKEGMTPVNKVEISSEIIYVPVDKTAFIAFSAKQRCYDYGNYLTKILDIAEKATFTHKPQVVSDSKYELKVEDISFEDIKHLAKFNLKKDWDSSENKDIREIWRTTRQRQYPPSYTKDPKPTPIEKLEAGDIVYRVGRPQDRYEVRGVQEKDSVFFAECYCLYHDSFSGLVGQTFSFKEVILIERGNNKQVA